MKVWIDQDLCTGDGVCEELCPSVFTVLNTPGGESQMATVSPELEDSVTEAADECPGECIFLVND